MTPDEQAIWANAQRYIYDSALRAAIAACVAAGNRASTVEGQYTAASCVEAIRALIAGGDEQTGGDDE